MSVKFGTSGLRGLATDLSNGVASAHARGFARFLVASGHAKTGDGVMVAADLRESSPLIKAQVLQALALEGLSPIDCGFVPTPVLAHAAMSAEQASVMVTGSHIPAERNGIKFYLPGGEITKEDEIAITRHAADVGAAGPDLQSAFPVREGLSETFLERLSASLPAKVLRGFRVGLYEHSTVARDLLSQMLEDMGAEVVRLGRSSTFLALDTEAVEPEKLDQLRQWSSSHRLDAIVSADGDGDRPLVADETGTVLRGDVIGLITAGILKVAAVATPVTSNSGLERSFSRPVWRTRVGSPYVIAAMQEAKAKGFDPVLGFEANGGVLLGGDVQLPNGILRALPTRDAFLPIACTLMFAMQKGVPLSAAVKQLALPQTAATKLEGIPDSALRHFLGELAKDDAYLGRILVPLGRVTSIDRTDGFRAKLSDGSILFLRPSGNEPALRCYVEASSATAAGNLLESGSRLVLQAINSMAVPA